MGQDTPPPPGDGRRADTRDAGTAGARPGSGTAAKRGPRRAVSTTKRATHAKAPTAKAGTAKSSSSKPPSAKPEPIVAADDGVPLVVGIGASAGGLEALRGFVAHVPDDTQAAFVVAQHLAPHHASMLVPLIARETRLPVREVEDGMRLEPGTIAITPPNYEVTVTEGVLHLSDPPAGYGPKPSVDTFFTALAEDRGERAVGVILSGTGSDGAAGVRAIKAAGGMALAQDEQSAKYASMPNAAIATGCVDVVLSPERMGAEISAIERLERQPSPIRGGDADRGLARILDLIDQETGMDFRQYKRGTIDRRVEVQMAANKLDGIDAYLAFLDAHPDEVDRLARSILISVTAFFRDPEAFEALSGVIGQIADRAEDGSTIRVWVPGCATGEEAYSIALLLADRLGSRMNAVRVNIFATDIDEDAGVFARKAVYDDPAVRNVPERLLKRFFRKTSGSYQVAKPIRDMVVFARHNVAKDPPFLNIDLLSCRNLLIYFSGELQQTVLHSFQYALKPGGFLFLGRSETLGNDLRGFSDYERNHRLFKRTPMAVGPRPAPTRARPRMAPARHDKPADRPPARGLDDIVHASLAQGFAPPSVLVDEAFTVLHLHGDCSPFLRFPQGRLELDVTALAITDIQVLLRSLLFKCKRERQPVDGADRIGAEADGAGRLLHLHVRPVDRDGGEPGYLVSFQERVPAALPDPGSADGGGDHILSDKTKIAELEYALKHTRDHLQTVIEELEASNQELQSLNEEMQASNEELQASNEELETSNEELQSTNEELLTINDELEQKSIELVNTNTQLENVQNSISSPLVVLNRQRQIQRFNVDAGGLFTLTLGDIGKSIFAIDAKVDMGDLAEDLMAASDAGRVGFDLLGTGGGRSWRKRVLPFYEDTGVITGAVIIFADISELIAQRQSLEHSERRLRILSATQAATLNGLPANIALLDEHGVVVAVNEGWVAFARANGYSDTGAEPGIGLDYLAMCGASTGAGAESAHEAARGIRSVIGGQETLFTLEYPCHAPDRERWFRLIVTPVGPGDRAEAEALKGAVVMHIDVTDRVLTERSLEEARQHAVEASQAKSRFLATMSHELRTPLNAVIGFSEMMMAEMFGPVGDPRYKSYVEEIHASGSHLLKIITQLLDLSRVESGRIELRESQLDLAEELAACVRMVEPQAQAKSLALTLLAGQPVQLRADPQLLRQMVLNLLANAVKFTDPGGAVSVSIERGPGTDQGVGIAVSDTGRGMAEADIGPAMEPFVQLEQADRQLNEGLGLGLPLVRTMAELHQGWLEIRSEPGAGTEATIWLPRSRITSAHPSRP